MGAAASVAALGLALAGGALLRQGRPGTPANGAPFAVSSMSPQALQGLKLYTGRCARCHGDDARGDDGPELRGLTKSDTKLAAIIKNGVKGKMPKFGPKLAESDVAALVAFIRSLPD